MKPIVAYTLAKGSSSNNSSSEQSVLSSRLVHFSIDDFYLALKDITANAATYSSVFNNTTFAYLKYLHDSYGAVVTLFLYAVDSSYDVSNVTTKFKTEFEQNSSWLKFSFHTQAATTDYSTETVANLTTSYTKVKNAVINFAGYKSWSNVTRLNYFHGTDAAIQTLAGLGLLGVLSADDDRISYGLTDSENTYLKNYGIFLKNDTVYFKTNIRYENFNSTTLATKLTTLENTKLIAVFTHEVYLVQSTYQALIEQSFQWLNTRGYVFSSFESFALSLKMTKIGMQQATPLSVTGVSVTPDAISIVVSYTAQLTAAISPSNASNQSVTWTSSNTGVATVSSTGIVTAVAAGSCTITCTTADGGFTDTTAITVTATAPTFSATFESGTIVPSGTTLTYSTVTARARTASFLPYTSGTFTVTNPSVYNIAIYECTAASDSAFVGGTPSWVSSDKIDNANTQYVKIAVKKLDGTAFTASELSSLSSYITYTP